MYSGQIALCFASARTEKLLALTERPAELVPSTAVSRTLIQVFQFIRTIIK
jgi:hypothetical protein